MEEPKLTPKDIFQWLTSQEVTLSINEEHNRYLFSPYYFRWKSNSEDYEED